MHHEVRAGRLPRGRLVSLACAAAVCMTLKPGPTLAQTSTDEEVLRQRQRQEEAERQRRQAEPEVRSERPPLDDSDDLPSETPCFEITDIRVEGAQRGFGWAQRWVRRYQGRCIGEQGVNLIARRLTQRILSRGKVTTRVGIPEQQLASGTLRLVLIAGTLRRVTYADEDGPRTRWQTALPMRPGDVLDIRDLDQGLEQLKRLPSQDVEFAIRPGGAPGESDLELRVKRTRPWRTSLTVDDGGSEATGKLQGTLTASLDDPLTLNDLFSVTAQHDADFEASDHQSWGGSGFYSVPWGYWTLSLSGGTNRYEQTVAGGVERFTYRGRSANAEAKLERVVLRSQAGKTSLSLAFGKRWSQTYINDVEIEVQRREVTVATGGVSHRHAVGPGTLEVGLEVRRGLPFWAQEDTATGKPGAPTTQYTLAVLDVNLTYPFRLGLPLRYRNHTRYQYTRDRLLVSEQFAIGGRYTVRGFDGEQTLTAERGWFTRNDVGATLPWIGQELYAAVDYGRVAGPSSAPLPGIILTGAAAGLRGGWRFVSYDAFVGWPLRKPEAMKVKRPTWGFMVTVQY